jgi:DNA-binding HxlR family transcriptional regulator
METRQTSALADALEVVGDRWAILIVEALLGGPMRFGDLQESVPGIAPNILTQRLRALTDARVVVAEPYSTRPPRMVYALTDAGRELGAPLRSLTAWAERRTGEISGRRHRVCDTPLEVRWYCPSCEVTVDDDDAAADDLVDV